MSTDTTSVKAVAQFDEELRAANLFGQWNIEPFLAQRTDGPNAAGTPMVWPYALVREKLDEACVIFPDNMRARRNVTFIVPDLARRGSTPTIIAGMQLVLPGEIAGAHRHSIAALRFVVEGDSQLYTVVNGRREVMETNDLIFTPAYSWHDHHNEGARKGVWLDVLDSPLVISLNQTFFEPFAAKTQTLAESEPAPRMRYAWSEMRAALTASAASSPPDPYVGTLLAYSALDGTENPLATMTCFAQTLPADFRGLPFRRTPSAVYYVVSGHGSATIGDTTLAWGPKDTFVVPAWATHCFTNTGRDEAVLFSVTDETLLRAIGLFREERLASG